MLKFLPLLLIVIYAIGMWMFSAWRLRRELNERSIPLVDDRLAPYLAAMAKALDLKTIRAQIYEIEPVNGLAAPDGRIFLTRGFMRKLDADEVTAPELASVIAHELGHVAHGHARRRMIDFAGQNVIRTILMGVLGRFLPGLGAMIANAISSAFVASLSRKDEFEADEYASALLVKSGIGIAPQISLFRKLDRMGPRGNTPAWLMSHPPTDRRIAAIETRAKKWQDQA